MNINNLVTADVGCIQNTSDVIKDANEVYCVCTVHTRLKSTKYSRLVCTIQIKKNLYTATSKPHEEYFSLLNQHIEKKTLI